jgi:hypothetical protein
MVNDIAFARIALSTPLLSPYTENLIKLPWRLVEF